MIILIFFELLYFSNASAEADIYEKIKYYDKRIRPFEKQSPIGVKVSYHIPNLDSVDEQAMDYRLGMFLRMRWKDPRLTWGQKELRECVEKNGGKLKGTNLKLEFIFISNVFTCIQVLCFKFQIFQSPPLLAFGGGSRFSRAKARSERKVWQLANSSCELKF